MESEYNFTYIKERNVEIGTTKTRLSFIKRIHVSVWIGFEDTSCKSKMMMSPQWYEELLDKPYLLLLPAFQS